MPESHLPGTLLQHAELTLLLMCPAVDRVAGPPPSLYPMLRKIKRYMVHDNCDLEGVLKAAGGTKYGTMCKSRFNSALRDEMRNVHVFSEAELIDIDKAYGTGAPDLHVPGTFESIAWMDFIEDLGEFEAGYWAADDPRTLALMNDLDDDGNVDAPKALSMQAQMLDMLDGVDGAFDDSEMFKHRSLMGDKRWA